jgi:hypothetical protein
VVAEAVPPFNIIARSRVDRIPPAPAASSAA